MNKSSQNAIKKWIFCLSIFIIISSLFFYTTPSVKALDAEIDWPNIPGIPAEKQITNGSGSLNPNFGLNDLVKYIYNFFVMIGGLAALGMIIYGGVQYLTSSGSPAKTGAAKDKITSALLGLLLLLGSYILLNLLNPDILLLRNMTI
jgi:hypothetical protein